MAVFSGPEIVNSGLIAAIDFANPKSFSTNTFPSGQDIYGWYVPLRGNATGNGCTVERDYTTSRSPADGVPLKMIMTGTGDPHIGSYNAPKWNISTAVTGQTWKVSVYAKSSVPMNNCEIYIFGANSLGVSSIVGGGWYGISSKTISVTTEWQRFDHFITFNNAEIAYIQMRLDGPNQTGLENEAVWWDGLQVEPVSLTRFNPKYNQNYSQIFDLVDASSDTVFSYPAYNETGYITFDGTNNYADLSVGTLGDVITVEMLAKLNSSSSLMPFGFSNYDVYSGSSTLSFNTGASDRYGLDPTDALNAGVFGNWRHFCFVMFNNTSLSGIPYTNNKIYVNGVSYPLTQILNTQSPSVRSFTNGLVRLSGWVTSTQYKMPMDLALFKIYNKQLSDAEIQQNFEATRSRYGI